MSIFRTPHAATSFAVTRRNILAISGISASSFFEGCKLKDPDDQERVREFFAKPPCLVKGTRVATPTGDVKIEELEVGDCVSMLNSESRRIRWIGHRRFKFGRHEAASGLISPVRFSKGSLEADLPRPARPCAPIFNCNDLRKRARIRSHLRSALSPWIDLRNDCDRVRDLLTARS
jgi:hypothetical protein